MISETASEMSLVVASAMTLDRADVTVARQTWMWKPVLGAKGSVEGAEVIPLESMEWTLILEADGFGM